MNRKTLKKRKTFLMIWIMLLLGAVYLLNNYFNGKTEVNYKKYLIIGKENVFVIYDDKISLKIPNDTYIGNDKKIDDYVSNKKYSELFQVMKSIFPEGLEGYVVPKGNIDAATKNSVNIPLIKNGDRNYILTSELNKAFVKLYYGENAKEIKHENVMIDVLNATGQAGYSKKTGEKIKKALSYNYNPATYEEESDYSYVINNSLNKTEVEALIMSTDLKYIKIKEKSKLPTPAQAVIVLGKEPKGLFEVDIYRNKEQDKQNKELLEKNGYQDVKSLITNKDIEKPYIEYSTEDYYIAYKISKYLGIDSLVETKDLNAKINVYVR